MSLNEMVFCTWICPFFDVWCFFSSFLGIWYGLQFLRIWHSRIFCVFKSFHLENDFRSILCNTALILGVCCFAPLFENKGKMNQMNSAWFFFLLKHMFYSIVCFFFFNSSSHAEADAKAKALIKPRMRIRIHRFQS